jgi:hypothetical protein
MTQIPWQDHEFNSIRGVGDRWDDLKAPFIGRKIDVTNGHLDYDFTELGIKFQTNAEYSTDPVGLIYQMPHHWKLESELRPHIHWIQSEDHTPNWLIAYRAYINGEAPPAWTLAAWTSNAFDYVKDGLQITQFPAIDMSGINEVSGFLDVQLYRDTGNASSLFSGADPYTVAALAKEFDLHYIIDSRGSREELSK